MLPVEVVRSYQDIIWHLLDEIQRLQMDNIRLHRDVKSLQQCIPQPGPEATPDRETAP